MDKNYWLRKYRERKFLNKIWTDVYYDCGLSWKGIIDYVESGRFKNDLFDDLWLLAEDEVKRRSASGDSIDKDDSI